MRLVRPRLVIRDWKDGDAPSLARHANNRKIWINVRDRFPHPYTDEDADQWVHHCITASPATDFAIDVDGVACGGIGVMLREDVERVSAEIGYWIGEEFWGRGLMTEAVSAFVPWALNEFDLTRIYARVFDFNEGSARVLEKSGFVREARLRRSVIKEGRVIDEFQFAAIREE